MFSSFHLKSPLSLHSHNLSRVSNVFLCLIFFCKYRESLINGAQCFNSLQGKFQKYPFLMISCQHTPETSTYGVILMLSFYSTSISVYVYHVLSSYSEQVRIKFTSILQKNGYFCHLLKKMTPKVSRTYLQVLQH